MINIISYMKRQSIISITTLAAFVLILLSLWNFTANVKLDIQTEMFAQTTNIRDNCILLLQKEIIHLRHITETASTLISQIDIQSEDDIIQTLKSYSLMSNIERTYFVTEDNLCYGSFDGCIGYDHEIPYFGGMEVSDIEGTVVSQPFLSKDMNEVVFGVLAPVTMGDTKGVLISSYDTAHLVALFLNDFLEGQAFTGLIDNEGNVITGTQIYTNDNRYGLNIFSSFETGKVDFIQGSIPDMQYEILSGNSGIAIYSTGDMARFCSYAPAGINNWYVVTAVPESILQKQVNSIENHGILLTVQLVIIMAVLLTVVTVVRFKEAKKIHTVLERSAMNDSLTAIYNRGAVESGIKSFLLNAKGVHALFIMDIDSFKQINDTYGHHEGDAILKYFAVNMQDIFRPKDIIGRMGGDEFIALLTNCEDIDFIRSTADAIVNVFQKRIQENPNILTPSISIGIALYDADGSSFDELYRHADEALYHTKHLGKNGFSFYSDTTHTD